MVTVPQRKARTARRAFDPLAAPRPFRALNAGALFILTLLFLLPFWVIFIASFTPEKEISVHGYQIFPSNLTLYNYEYLFTMGDKFVRSFFVTLGITVVGTANTLFFTSMGAYVLSRRYLPYRKTLTLYVFLTLMINAGTIPWYLMVKDLGMFDSPLSLIIPGTIATWNLILIRNYFMSLPDSLEESAKIDGAGSFGIFIRIFVPVSKPILATIIVYLAIGYWNEWYAALLFIVKNTQWKTLQLLIREFLSSLSTLNSRGAIDLRATVKEGIPSESLKMAAIVIATVPIIAVYPFLQKHFVKGIMIGSIKG